jgi:hypothetical protein
MGPYGKCDESGLKAHPGTQTNEGTNTNDGALAIVLSIRSLFFLFAKSGEK